MSDQRAMLDDCTLRRTCTAEMHLTVDTRGHVVVDEAFLARLLVDAGWERTS